ncbi:RNA polymerase sigma-70 factor [Pedobacter sp. GR22-6]|uniref:RNA polymerase sigma-70 factor n=1 Tax=Pedobacter sp. GR22-6 TaxID=3127957 RepID=UPI00307CDECC
MMSPKNSIESIITGQDLLLLIEQGDKDIFTDFYSSNFRKLILVSDRYVRDIAAAEEIVQDIFLKIWEDKAVLETIKSIKAYLYRSVVNSSINYINRQKSLERHHLHIAEQLSDELIDSEDERNKLIVLLYQEIEFLPEKCQLVFKLSRLEGLKYRDIAAKLDLSEKTVENHMGNALRILRSRVLKRIEDKSSSQKTTYLYMLSAFLY